MVRLLFVVLTLLGTLSACAPGATPLTGSRSFTLTVENRCFGRARQVLIYLDKQLLGSVVDSGTFTFIPEGTQTFKAVSAVAGGPTYQQTFRMDSDKKWVLCAQ